MSDTSRTPTYTSFDGERRLASGPMLSVALAVRRAQDSGAVGPVLIFDDETGRSIDIDTRGTEAELAERFASREANAANEANAASEVSDTAEASEVPRGRGRPKLGVVAREVTLLPRHWEWLAAQPGGASVVLRKLVDEARRANADRDRIRNAQARAYHFMSAMAGNLAGFEEASRALFANDEAGFRERIATWPKDVREHVVWLGFGE